MQKTDALGYPFSGRFPGVGTPKQTFRFPPHSGHSAHAQLRRSNSRGTTRQ